MKSVKDLVKVELEKQIMENGKRSWYAKDFSSIDIEARDDGSYQVVIYFQTTGIIFKKQSQSYASKQSLKQIRDMVRRACKRASNDDSSDEEFLYGFNKPHYHFAS